MGIPHLFTHLGPYGVDTLLTGIKIIIDGPSFAYHIHSLCSSNRAGQVSHKLLCDAAISWLDALSKGSKITAIYFDGYLPASKHPVRLDRLLKSSTRLQNLHSSNPKACPSHLLSESNELIPAPFPTTYARREPPHHPPFLVPAILERLRLSEKYAPLIRLVPGEADAYCADHALHHGGCVLTSDSDLLVHDLGPRGAVILFHDLRTGTLDGHRGLIAARYSPASIAERLRLPPTSAGIQRFAHELSRDPYKEFFAARAEGETLWSTIHLAAQVQACYYSLRILSQVLSLLDAVAGGGAVSGAVLAGLKTELAKLPALEAYPAVKDVTALLEEMRARGQIRRLAEFVGVEQRALVPLTKGEEKERKEKKRKADAVAVPVAKRVSSNPFDILGEDC
ncbi:hypothetical protein VdG2_08706 [Verticillium dahliae VDG2]|nr:hypothetical protein VdG2_08706 [Verticillium dahliae VDG2]